MKRDILPIIDKTTQGGGRSLSYLFAAFLAFAFSCSFAHSSETDAALENPVNPVQKAAGETAWIDESIASASRTGQWSQEVLYNRTTGVAKLDGEYVFTPNEPSAGKYVTLKASTTLDKNYDDLSPTAGVQGAIRIGPNDGFQVWTLLRQGYGGQADNGWLDVAALGVTPVSGREYEVSMVFDYAARRYSALVKDEKGVWQLLMTAARVAVFPIAAKGDRVEHIIFEGKTKFRSLKGSYTSTGPNLRAWSKSNGPQAPIYGIEANRIVRRAQSTGLDQIERSASPNLRDWSKSNSLQAPICGIGPNQTVCRLQSMGLDQIEWLFDTTGTERSKNGH